MGAPQLPMSRRDSSATTFASNASSECLSVMTEKSPRLSNEGSYHDSLQEEDEDQDERAPLNGQLPVQLQSGSLKTRSKLSIGLRIILASILVIASASIIFNLLSSPSSSTSSTSSESKSLFWYNFGLDQSSSGDESYQSERLDSSSIVFGLGIGDVTGPIVQTNQMGYASLPQTNTGLHIRQRSRAFIVGSSASGTQRKAKAKMVKSREDGGSVQRQLGRRDDGEDPVDGLSDRWVFINSDICMGDTAVRRAVIEKLRELYPNTYGERNVAFVGTHSHSGVAGYLNALLPTLTSLGVVQETFDAIVDGTVVAIQKAHADYEARRTKEGADETKNKIWFGNTTLKGAHINRSAYSYGLNPASERAQYDSDQEDEFALIRFNDDTPDPKGLLSWYAVHGTSLYENNTLTSGDNKGLAALVVEGGMNPDALPGQNSFIAGFSQSSVGDTTPNVGGAFCDSGDPCDPHHSTCPDAFGQGRVETCHGRGPAWGDSQALATSPTGGYDFHSNEIIANMQADAAKEVFNYPTADGQAAQNGKLIDITGAVGSAKLNVDMSQYTFKLDNGTEVTTCPAALGYGFAGGTTDGPGAFDFVQGANKSDPHNPFWDIVKTLLVIPSKKQIQCQYPKRVLLDIGEQHTPYDWGPSIVETQILRVGALFILIAPGEFTTMSGRRIKKAVSDSIIKNGLLPEGVAPIVQISGPSNTYGHYIATIEEYDAQRYEGASTLFGPHTLEAYIDIYSNTLIPSLKDGAAALPKGRLATDNIKKAVRLQSKVIYDNPQIGHKFGDVLTQPSATYQLSSSPNVTTTFVSANPRNDLHLEGSFVEVQQYVGGDGDNAWKTVRTDGHHSTLFRWTLTSEAVGSSRADLAWLVEEGTPAGRYRIRYNGDSKTPVTGKIKPFSGVTNEFTLQ